MNATSPAHPPSQARPRRHVESWCRPADHSCPHHSQPPQSCSNQPRDATTSPIHGFRLRQRRWEFPQGTAPGLVDAEPAALAQRELREETGLRATTFEAIGELDVAPGMSSQRGWVFLATGIVEGEADREHEEQDMRSAWFSRDEVEQMIRGGVIVDAQSIAAYGLFLLRGE